MWPDCRGSRAGRPARLPRQCGQTERLVIISRENRGEEETKKTGNYNRVKARNKENEVAFICERVQPSELHMHPISVFCRGSSTTMFSTLPL